MSMDKGSNRNPETLLDEIEALAFRMFGIDCQFGFTFRPRDNNMSKYSEDYKADKDLRYRVILWREPVPRKEEKFDPPKTEKESLENEEKKAILSARGHWRESIREAVGTDRAEAIRSLWKMLFLGSDLEDYI